MKKLLLLPLAALLLMGCATKERTPQDITSHTKWIVIQKPDGNAYDCALYTEKPDNGDSQVLVSVTCDFTHPRTETPK